MNFLKQLLAITLEIGKTLPNGIWHGLPCMMVTGQNRSGTLVSPTEALSSQAVGGSTKPAVPVAAIQHYDIQTGVQKATLNIRTPCKEDVVHRGPLK